MLVWYRMIIRSVSSASGGLRRFAVNHQYKVQQQQKHDVGSSAKTTKLRRQMLEMVLQAPETKSDPSVLVCVIMYYGEAMPPHLSSTSVHHDVIMIFGRPLIRAQQ